MSLSRPPLEGIRVLDLTRLLPGSVCTQMLVDLGAEVIRIEDPQGGDYARWAPPQIDGQSVFFRMDNRGKRSVILNLKDPRGQHILHRLVQNADVVVEGFRPGVMAKLNADYEALNAINPKLVYCSLSGYGADGPQSQLSGHDLNYVSQAGLIGATAQPQVAGGQFADIGGAYAAVAAITAALFRRERDSERRGGYIDISFAEAALPFALYAWTEAVFGQVMPEHYPLPGHLSGGLACYNVYHCADGLPVALAALEAKFWINFCNAVKRPDLIPIHQLRDQQSWLKQELQAIFSQRIRDDWAALLDSADCCFSVVASPADVHENAQFRARGALGRFDDGTTWLRSPLRISDHTPEITNHVPGYGQHTREVLLAAGYSDAELELLTADGVIK
jgi:alpha-methylacyl-CoA racemase